MYRANVGILWRRPSSQDPSNHVWVVRAFDDCTPTERRASAFKIRGICFSDHRPFTHTEIPYHFLGCCGEISWEKDVASITSSTDWGKATEADGGFEIGIRYNTDQIKNPDALPWRVLVYDQSSMTDYTETQVKSFHFTGSGVSTSKILPMYGERWHLSCRGTVCFEDLRAHIITTDV